MVQEKRETALRYILKALIPYSRENLALSFKPNTFFNDLERLSGHKRTTIRTALKRAKTHKLIYEKDGMYGLTEAGAKLAKRYSPKLLDKGAELMVIYDIPERRAADRRKLRWLLRSCGFRQIQKSVWVTNHDYTAVVEEAISDGDLREYVFIYECLKI